MMKCTQLTSRLALFLVSAVSCAWAQPQVIATGLQGPQKLVVTPQGNFLVSETSQELRAGRVSFVTRGGARRSLLENLPSGVEVTGGGSGPTAMALRGRMLYIALGGGDAERRAAQPGVSVYNPAGTSSPIFSSILEFRFSADIDTLSGTFRMTAAHERALSGGDAVEMEDGAGGRATVSVLADLPDAVPDANTVYRFSNPWGLALTADGRSLYMVDASQNTLLRIDTTTGRWQRLMSFPPVPNATPVGPPVVDSVPTSVRTYGSQVLVSFLTGFPFAPRASHVLAVNPEERTTEPFIFNVTSAVDVLWQERAGARARFFVLEHSQNQRAQPAVPGRLLRYDSPEPVVVTDQLTLPVSMALDESASTIYVLDLTGRIVAVPF